MLELYPDGLPEICTVFPTDDCSTNQHYHDVICQTLKKLPPSRFFQDRVSRGMPASELAEQFHELLPLVTHSEILEPPFNLSFYVLSKYSSDSFRFFIDMFSRWLVPGERNDVLLFYAVDFKMPALSNQVYTVCELMIRVDSQELLDKILANLSNIISEVVLGFESSYYASRILEIKGLTASEKTALIQEHMASLIKRRPDAFGRDLFSDMQHMMVTCRDGFKAARSYRHLSRLISVSYLFKKDLCRRMDEQPEKRHLSLKLFKAQLQGDQQGKKVLGIVVGVNFLHDHELFEEPHLLRAICHKLPCARPVEGSFAAQVNRKEGLCTVYLEVEKTSGCEFTSKEMELLRKELPDDLKDRVEHLMHPIFMPHNEEETMRDIVALSTQLKYVRDIPQVIITFEEQTDTDIVFTIVIARVRKGAEMPIWIKLSQENTLMKVQHDRTRTVGWIRKRYPKEATVFRVSLPKGIFFRGDYSLDLHRARQVVAAELEKVIGDYRDYNGGMMSKQSEALYSLKALLGDQGNRHDFLLENFFFSVEPAVMCSLLESEVLKSLFQMVLQAFDQREPQFEQDIDHAYAAIPCEVPQIRTDVCAAIEALQISPTELGATFVTVHGIPCQAYVYRCEDASQRTAFLTAVREAGRASCPV